MSPELLPARGPRSGADVDSTALTESAVIYKEIGEMRKRMERLEKLLLDKHQKEDAGGDKKEKLVDAE